MDTGGLSRSFHQQGAAAAAVQEECDWMCVLVFIGDFQVQAAARRKNIVVFFLRRFLKSKLSWFLLSRSHGSQWKDDFYITLKHKCTYLASGRFRCLPARRENGQKNKKPTLIFWTAVRRSWQPAAPSGSQTACYQREPSPCQRPFLHLLLSHLKSPTQLPELPPVSR